MAKNKRPERKSKVGQFMDPKDIKDIVKSIKESSEDEKKEEEVQPPEDLNIKVKKETEQASHRYSIEDTKNFTSKYKPGMTRKGRVKFTTMLKPEYKKLLQVISVNKGLSVADVLEGIVEDYFNIETKDS